MGPGGCGKSALAVRMLSRRFISEYSPVLEDTYHRTINNGGLQISLEVMDTSEGQGETFHDDGTVSSGVGAKVLIHSISHRITTSNLLARPSPVV